MKLQSRCKQVRTGRKSDGKSGVMGYTYGDDVVEKCNPMEEVIRFVTPA
jgi:hypothetical protein